MARVMKTIYVKEEVAGKVDEVLTKLMNEHQDWALDFDSNWDVAVEPDEEE